MAGAVGTPNGVPPPDSHKYNKNGAPPKGGAPFLVEMAGIEPDLRHAGGPCWNWPAYLLVSKSLDRHRGD